MLDKCCSKQKNPKYIINETGTVYLVFISPRLLWCESIPIIKPYKGFTISHHREHKGNTPDTNTLFDQDKDHHANEINFIVTDYENSSVSK